MNGEVFRFEVEFALNIVQLAVVVACRNAKIIPVVVVRPQWRSVENTNYSAAIFPCNLGVAHVLERRRPIRIREEAAHHEHIWQSISRSGISLLLDLECRRLVVNALGSCDEAILGKVVPCGILYSADLVICKAYSASFPYMNGQHRNNLRDPISCSV